VLSNTKTKLSNLDLKKAEPERNNLLDAIKFSSLGIYLFAHLIIILEI